MQIYKAPIQEIQFLFEALGYQDVAEMDYFSAYDLETAIAVLEECGKFCTNELLPLNRSGDQEGVKYNPETHEVTTPKGFKELYAKFIENGFIGLCHDEKYGGGGAPSTIGVVLSEMATATNKSFSMCPGLANGLIESLTHHGSQEQIDKFVPKLVSGEWGGTMCLTEPHAGTDLGLLTTKAVPEGDHYIINGTKIWITFGEHDLTENILHLVLARLPDAPQGVKGISVFIVPKFLDDGTRNPVFCGGLEHKMGIHGSPTCVINLEGAVGYLIGEPHKGMRAMFTMMNHARINVGVEGVALGDIAYQTAVAFAKDRRQSRSLNPAKNDPEHPADNILVHPDVRRMLLNVKSSTEAMRALAMWTAMLNDVSLHHENEAKREEAQDLVALLTPVVKSYLTERGFANVSEAMQVCGGSGYTTDWSIEQYLRDARIAMIYEGTNHIQALDLVGRKLPMGMGRLYKRFNDRITEIIKENQDNEAMAEFTTPLKETSKKLGELTMLLSGKAMEDPEEAGAVASNYLNVFAYTAMAYVWCRMAQHALGQEGGFYTTKLKTGRYFMNNILPEVDSYCSLVKAGKACIMDFDPSEF